MKKKYLFSSLSLLFLLWSQAGLVRASKTGSTLSGVKESQKKNRVTSIKSSTGNKLLLLRAPSMSKSQITFEYGGEIWIMDRSGGKAHRLVTGSDVLAMPIFSPDGSMVAYTGTYDHNTDVYVVSADGGQPRRLTFHPGNDIAVGWTPDGKDILFRSRRFSFSDPDQLYKVPVNGGFPRELPLSRAETGSFSPDGTHIAYVPAFQWEPYWKGYRGGQTTPIWIANLSNSSVVKLPRENANFNDPMWVGNKVYYLSDQDGPITLFSYNTKTKKVVKVINNDGFDITSASAGPGGIIYSRFGQLYIYNFTTKQSHHISVTVKGDLPQLRPHYKKVADEIRNYDISPNGVRAVFEAHGEILTVPTKHGSIDNLTSSPGVEDRGPAWSPDGKSIAYFADKGGEYDLYIKNQDGIGSVRKISLGQLGAYYYDLRWSPDGNKLTFTDQKLNLWYVDLTQSNPKPIKVDTDAYDDNSLHEFDARWSPDSQWLTYTRIMPNFLHSVFIYSLKDHQTHQITDLGSDCLYPVFGADGNHLYFTSSTNTGLSEGKGPWEMTSMERPVERNIYAVNLKKGFPSPIATKSGYEDTESSKSGKNDSVTGKQDNSKNVEIDFSNMMSRAVALPVSAANYKGMMAGKTGILYLIKSPLVTIPGHYNRNGAEVLKYVMKTHKTQTLISGISGFKLSSNGTKAIYRKGGSWFIGSTAGSKIAHPTKLKISDMRVYVDPHKEWTDMYYESWRIERAFFYNPNYDGLNINKAEKEFAAYLPGIASRTGLNFLFKEMLSYISVGHEFVRGGTEPKMENIKVGLLGANYKIDHNRYKITKIFTSGSWNPDLYAPLAQPGLEVETGDYVLAVNGRPITGEMNIYSAFEDMANKVVTLTVGPNPSMKDSHQITVKTIPSEFKLRNEAWIEHNKELVDKLSDGKLGYVYLPNTGSGGFNNFNRYYFSQVDKKGVIIDERYNHGGDISDYIIQYLKRKPMSMFVTRYGKKAILPQEAIFGPKVMVINQFAGSGGDALPWYFKMDHIGTLVGKKTWGGLVGIGGYPPLMDGGSVTAPRMAIEGLDGTFPVEGHGIAPDVSVWQNPELVRKGHDPQLEKAVQVALKELKDHPLPAYKKPPYRNYHPQLPPLPTDNTGSNNR